MMQDSSGEKPQKSANYDENVAAPALPGRPIVLIGMPGAGKSSMGRLLAKKTGLPFIDCDAAFENAAGCTISDYFEKHGEEQFRQDEFTIIDKLLKGAVQVIAGGGGIITLPQTREALKNRACVVWLVAPLEVLAERCRKAKNRPLLKNGNLEETLSNMLAKREALYREVAAITVSTEKAVGDEALNAILAGLKAWRPQP
jgi:shikimate kinase